MYGFVPENHILLYMSRNKMFWWLNLKNECAYISTDIILCERKKKNEKICVSLKLPFKKRILVAMKINLSSFNSFSFYTTLLNVKNHRNCQCKQATNWNSSYYLKWIKITTDLINLKQLWMPWTALICMFHLCNKILTKKTTFLVFTLNKIRTKK